MIDHRATILGGAVALGCMVISAAAAGGRMNQRQLQKYQQQQMQRMIREALGPVADIAPDPSADRPMSGALFGQGAGLVEAMKTAQQQMDAQLRSGKAISAEALAEALPPNIADYLQVRLDKSGPGEEGAPTRTLQDAAASVNATYENAAGQVIEVKLMDVGLLMDLVPEESRPEPDEEVPQAETEEAVVGEKKIQGITAKIYYDRFNESGTLSMKANRVMLSIQGRNIPFAMLETSANEIKVDALAKLGGSTP